MLARTFGCCRVVFNDAVRIQREARRVEENVSPTEVQRRVITEAKSREDRAWLGEVASVALVQSVRDAHRAHRNFIDSISGQRSGRKMGPPRFKSRKGNWQSFRLTRNGFAIRPNGQLYLAKIGEVMVRWSRELPSPPSSVTIIQEPDGHCYASFVVEVGRKQLVPVVQEAGVDLGITRLATVATTAGTCWEVANPNHLAGKRRKLARLEREKARRAKGG
jgi:putative transposase